MDRGIPHPHGRDQRQGLPPDGNSFQYEGFDRAEAPDPYTVSIHFKTPFAPFLNYAASRWNPIMPKEVYQAEGHFKDSLVGAGPYILDTAASQKGTRWVWKKNPTYLNADKV